MPFNLWEIPINTFCRKLDVGSKEIGTDKKFVNDLKSEFTKVFADKSGCWTKAEVKFELKDSTRPVFETKRNILFSLLEVIDKELQRLEKLGVIIKVDYFELHHLQCLSERKILKIRACADFSTGLNECQKDHSYLLPMPEDIFSKLNGGKIFSKTDLSEAYLQVKVDEECSKNLAINMHRGLFSPQRYQFSLKVAPSLFLQIMVTMLAGLNFAMVYLKGILIKSENLEEHKNHVREVFRRIQEYGFQLGPEKHEFFMNKIKYLGQIIDHEGRMFDPNRAEAIRNMPTPDNVTKLQLFLGLANYYSM